MRLLAVIPARGGSKRIPRKNLVPFGGRPLVEWSIALASVLRDVTHCIVTTDDAEIAGVAARAGATIVERPGELARDSSPTQGALLHAYDVAREMGIDPDGIMLLQPTNPLRPVEFVEDAIQKFESADCDSLIAVSRRRLKLGNVLDGYFVPSYTFGEQSRLMQDSMYENGCLYLIRKHVLEQRTSLLGSRVLAHETPRPFDDVDIDEPIDIAIGEAILASVRDRLAY